MYSFLILIAVLAVGTGAVGVALVAEIRARLRVDEVWKRVAERLGGTFNKRDDNAAFFPSLTTSKLVASIEGREVVVVSEKGKVVLTHITAGGTDRTGLLLSIHPRSALSSLSHVPGAHDDVATGDREFDRKFVVKANGEPLARSFLDGPIRRAITAASSYTFMLRDGNVVASRGVIEQRETTLVAAMTAAARLARRGDELVRQWWDVARQLGSEGTSHDGRWASVIVSADSVPMHIAIESETEPGCQTVVSAQPTRSSWERFVIGNPRPGWATRLRRVADTQGSSSIVLSDDPEKTAAWLAELRSQLDPLDPRGLSFDGRLLSLGLAGIVLDEERLRAAVRFVALLCNRMGTSPYR